MHLDNSIFHIYIYILRYVYDTCVYDIFTNILAAKIEFNIYPNKFLIDNNNFKSVNTNVIKPIKSLG